jgi:hypothetical protein
VNINTLYAPVAPTLDSYALTSEVSSFYATKSSVNSRAPINNPAFTGTVIAPAITLGSTDLSTTLNQKLNLSDFATTLTNTSYNTAFLGSLLSNFTLSGGGTCTVTNVSGSYFVRWSERAICIPIKGSTGTYYNIDCPASGVHNYTLWFS